MRITLRMIRRARERVLGERVMERAAKTYSATSFYRRSSARLERINEHASPRHIERYDALNAADSPRRSNHLARDCSTNLRSP
jgi:hypothetical protein